MSSYTSVLSGRATEVRTSLVQGSVNVTDHTHPQYNFTAAAYFVSLLSNWSHIELPSYTFQFIGGEFCYCFDSYDDLLAAFDAAITHWNETDDISTSTSGNLTSLHASIFG